MAIDIEAGLLEDPGWLRAATRRHGTTTTVELAGEWDLATTPIARRTIAGVFENRPESLVLDLARLRFIDSSGLHTCIELTHRSDVGGVRLLIIVGFRSVWRPFEICALTERLPLVAPPHGLRSSHTAELGYSTVR